MKSALAFRPYLVPFGLNLLFFLWAWLGVNNGKGVFYFVVDEIGAMVLLPLVFFANGLFWVLAILFDKKELASGFGLLLFLYLIGCIAVWTHAYLTGASA